MTSVAPPVLSPVLLGQLLRHYISRNSGHFELGYFNDESPAIGSTHTVKGRHYRVIATFQLVSPQTLGAHTEKIVHVAILYSPPL